jgi:hypothetical protein
MLLWKTPSKAGFAARELPGKPEKESKLCQEDA